MAFELEAHFGDEAARDWRTAMRVLNSFAERTNCPVGVSVIQWFAQKTAEADAAIREARKEARDA